MEETRNKQADSSAHKWGPLLSSLSIGSPIISPALLYDLCLPVLWAQGQRRKKAISVPLISTLQAVHEV